MCPWILRHLLTLSQIKYFLTDNFCDSLRIFVVFVLINKFNATCAEWFLNYIIYFKFKNFIHWTWSNTKKRLRASSSHLLPEPERRSQMTQHYCQWEGKLCRITISSFGPEVSNRFSWTNSTPWKTVTFYRKLVPPVIPIS